MIKITKDEIDIDSGPLLFGGIKAKRYGMIWSGKRTYPIWYRMGCKMMVDVLKSTRAISQSHKGI